MTWDTTPKPKAELNDVVVALRDAGLAYDMRRKIILISSERKCARWWRTAEERTRREVIKV